MKIDRLPSALPRTTPLRALGLLVALGVVSAGCGSGDGDVPSGPGEAPSTASPAVTIEASRFAPEEVVVDAGGTVTFTNEDPFAHTVTAVEGSPEPIGSGELGEGQTFEITIDESGAYEYFCRIHPTMRGTVTVR